MFCLHRACMPVSQSPAQRRRAQSASNGPDSASAQIGQIGPEVSPPPLANTANVYTLICRVTPAEGAEPTGLLTCERATYIPIMADIVLCRTPSSTSKGDNERQGSVQRAR
jgi:hypothetical protein